MSDEIPVDIRQFLLENVHSVEQLEILLLLRSDPSRDWTSQTMSQALYSTPSAVEMRLNDLVARKLARTGPAAHSYQYDATEPVRDGLVERLADLYRTRRVAIIAMIYSKQSSQVQAFADAFRIRKD